METDCREIRLTSGVNRCEMEDEYMKKISITALVSGGLIGAAITGGFLSYKKNKVIMEKENKINKFRSYYCLLNQWLALKEEGKKLESYFINNKYKTIAIYGMGELGTRLYNELKNSSIEVLYAIDKNATSIYSDLKIYGPNDKLDTVDVIVVTAIFAFDDIVNDLNKISHCPVISLEDVVYIC